MAISVCHLPPGTSKWNKIEHACSPTYRRTGAVAPLVSHEAVVNLIANTRTTTGLRIRAKLDRGKYETERTVTDAELRAVNVEPDEFHADWKLHNGARRTLRMTIFLRAPRAATTVAKSLHAGLQRTTLHYGEVQKSSHAERAV